MDYYKESLADLKKKQGRLSVFANATIENRDELSVAYTPGVAEPCREIAADPKRVYDYTIKGRTVAVITDGSAVLGLGNIGATAALPVMEGKCTLFRRFAGLSAFPIAVDTQDPDAFVETVRNIAPAFGGINLEDISAPRCFDIERRLIDALDIPVFHDDQHGTAIVVSAGLINACTLTGRKMKNLKVAIAGAGAAGTAIAKMLLSLGAADVIVSNSRGIISEETAPANYGAAFAELLSITNKYGVKGSLADAMRGADAFIGVSSPNIVTADMVRSMSPESIVFAMSNPEPEIVPEAALAAGARIVATGRSDYPNQINNVLAFPGVFKGALGSINKGKKGGAKRITENMKLRAAEALANYIPQDKLTPEHIIPSPFDEGVAEAVAEAVERVGSGKE